MKLSELGV